MNRSTPYKTVKLPNGQLIRKNNGGIWFVDENGHASEHSEFAYLVNPSDAVERAYQELDADTKGASEQS